MLGPWWRELQKLSLPSEIFVSQCKSMSVLRWLPCSLMQKVTVRRPFSKEPKLSSLFYSGNVQDRELEQIHSRYMNCLRTFIEYNYPQEPNRVQELLVKLPEVRSSPRPCLTLSSDWFYSKVQEAAGLLLESKMFYVPFLLNSTISSSRMEDSPGSQ